jgi:hypothetical protein
LIRSPSQWPGTSRASISSGRLIMRNDSGIMDVPASVAPAAPRGLRLPQGADHRRLQAAARLGVDRGIDGPPLGRSLCDTLPVNTWLTRAEGSPGFMCRSLCAICSGDQHR